jgi:hypothetical protein
MRSRMERSPKGEHTWLLAGIWIIKTMCLEIYAAEIEIMKLVSSQSPNKLPDIYFGSINMWIDEAAKQIYLTNYGLLLRVPLQQMSN